MEGMVSMATAQCATASIITLFLCPFITAAFDKWMQKRQKGIYSPEGWAYDKEKQTNLNRNTDNISVLLYVKV